MSRFRILTLLVALAALASALTACGSGGDGGDENPRKVLGSATLEGVSSATLDLSLQIKSEGKEDSDLDIALSGPIERKGKDLPELDLSATVEGTMNGEDVDLEGGLTLLSDRGFVNYKGTEYEIDPSTFGFAKSSFLATKRKRGNEATTYAINECQEAATEVDVGKLADNLSNEGSADVDGTETTKISGDLDVPAAVEAIAELAESPACKVQLEAAGLSLDELREARRELDGAAKEAHVEVYVGDDGIVRRLAAEFTAEPKGGDFEKVEVDFDLSLSKVNESQQIVAPRSSKPITVFFGKLGISPLELISGGEGLSILLEKVAADAFPSASLGGPPVGAQR